MLKIFLEKERESYSFPFSDNKKISASLFFCKKSKTF